MQRKLILAALCGFALLAPLSAEERNRTPNVIVDVSGRLIRQVFQRSIDETEPFEEEILDTPTSGLRRTIAKVDAELIPDPSHASLSVVVRGETCAEGIGRRPHALAFTESKVHFESRQQIIVDAHGPRGYRGPVSASAVVHLKEGTDRYGNPDSTEGDCVRCGFARDRREIEGIVAARAARRASLRQQEALIPILSEGKSTLKRSLAWADEVGLNLEGLCFSTAPDHIEARVNVRSKAAVGPAPALPERWDLALRIHESALNELARATLGGQTEKISDLRALIEKRTGILLMDGRKVADQGAATKALAKTLAAMRDKNAALTFAQWDPITVQFTPRNFTVAVHVAAIHYMGTTYAGLRARATFRVERTAEGVFVVREGPVVFSAADDGGAAVKEKLPAAQQALLTVVVNEMLKERWRLGDLRLPGPASRFGALEPANARIDQGWLALSWRKSP